MSAKRGRLSEADWLSQASSNLLFRCLHQQCQIKSPAIGRKLRLLSIAACRSIWESFTDESCRRAVEFGERAADKTATWAEIAPLVASIDDSIRGTRERLGCLDPYSADDEARCRELRRFILMGTAASYAASYRRNIEAVYFVTDSVIGLAGSKMEADTSIASLIRDIFGNPFRPITLDPRWLTSTVVDLSKAIYEERAWERMPILADALMDAGCDSDEIIGHCRGPGPHARGCWVVDLILGKG